MVVFARECYAEEASRCLAGATRSHCMPDGKCFCAYIDSARTVVRLHGLVTRTFIQAGEETSFR